MLFFTTQPCITTVLQQEKNVLSQSAIGVSMNCSDEEEATVAGSEPVNKQQGIKLPTDPTAANQPVLSVQNSQPPATAETEPSHFEGIDKPIPSPPDSPDMGRAILRYSCAAATSHSACVLLLAGFLKPCNGK